MIQPALLFPRQIREFHVIGEVLRIGVHRFG